ncbi:hypothetical protein OKA04_06075 [Luteolibacter flavescens]|uniref:DUF4383 domain-containing protein n=2 Tax=Luteolibacter flavescens TaxID=1859460 RepID=A0ABT3FL25_9BACT|nr:hypothetical protein [Luteolibacter flavescens]
MFVLSAAFLFGGAAGPWFAVADGTSTLMHGTHLAAGTILMGILVAVAGSLLFGRNPIRWGMGVPFAVYLGGMLVALVSGHADSVGLLYGAPLFLGVAIAAGTTASFLIDGVFSRPETA